MVEFADLWKCSRPATRVVEAYSPRGTVLGELDGDVCVCDVHRERARVEGAAGGRAVWESRERRDIRAACGRAVAYATGAFGIGAPGVSVASRHEIAD